MSIFAKIAELLCTAFILIVLAIAQGCGPAPQTSITTEDDETVELPPQMPGPEPSITTEEDDEDESSDESTDSAERITPPPIGD